MGRGKKVQVFETLTDASGRFRVPKGTKWAVSMPFPDGGAFFTAGICFQKDGYELLELDPWGESGQRYPGETLDMSRSFSLEPSSSEAGKKCFSKS
jgi:hypothetical protein